MHQRIRLRRSTFTANRAGRSVAVVALCGCAWLAACSAAVVDAQQPNIVLFLVDDMGWQDTSVELHSERTVWNDIYDTPNMERLAAQGMRFTNAYAASPVCSPTRTSIMSGMNPARSRISDWIGHGISQNSLLRSPSWRTTGIQPGDGITTLPTILGDEGYRTAHVGKAHFGGSGTAGANPTNIGFDINRGGSHVGSPRGNGSAGAYFGPFPSSTMPNLGAYGQGAYITDALTTEANAIIDQAVADEVPFFINLAHYAVHTPIGGQGDPGYVGAYQSAGRPNPEDDYAAMIASMDESLGAVLDNLEEEGVADNTIVIFMSDNGGLSRHARNNGGLRTVQTLDGDDVDVNFQVDNHNRPIRSGKGSAYEGGVRVPMMFAWAGQQAGATPINSQLPIAPGSVSHEPVISDDLFTTMLSMAQVSDLQRYTHDQGERIVDGNDLTPLLAGQQFTRDGHVVFHYPHQWTGDINSGPGIEPFSGLRSGDHRLTYFYGDGASDGVGRDPRLEVYDLSDDLGEAENLSATHPNLTRRLTNELVQYLLDVDAQVPIIRSTNLPAELPEIVDNVIGDMTDDDLVQIEDWLAFRAALNTSISAATRIEAEELGDLNFDLQVDRYDFLLFKAAYDEANGAGSLAQAISGVPEPSAATLLTLAGALCGVRLLLQLH